MKLFTLLLSSALLASPAFADIVVPGAAGTAQTPTPLNYYGSTGSHVQQIYASSYFTGPQTISAISFRAYPGAAPSGFFSNTVNVSNLIVSLGLTGASGDDSSGVASATFADNILSLQTVFSGALTLTTAATGTGPQPFDYTINFTNPFNYDPALGSLLLDVLIPTGATVSGSGFGFLTFDAANTLDDGIYSVVNIANGSDATGTLSTAGTITSFSTIPGAPGVPEPASWAMMLTGFLGIGGAMRARRSKAILAS